MNAIVALFYDVHDEHEHIDTTDDGKKPSHLDQRYLVARMRRDVYWVKQRIDRAARQEGS